MSAVVEAAVNAVEDVADVVGDVASDVVNIADNVISNALENPALIAAAIIAPELLGELAFESGGAALWAEELGGAAILSGETAAQAGGFLQSLMDVGVPWNVVQALPAAGVAGLTSGVTAAIQGKDPLEALVTGGAFSLLGGSVANALIQSGVAPSVATLGAQAVSQLARNGEIDPKSLLTSAALGVTNPAISGALQEAGVPSWMMPTAMNAVNQAILTGEVDPQALALAATGRFIGDAVRSADWGSQNILVPTNAARPTEAPAKTSEDTSGGLPTTNTADAQGALPTESPTQVASGPTMTDVPVREKNWGEPGYVYPDGTVEPAVKSGLDAVTTTPIPEPEVVPSTPLAPEPVGGLPVDQTLQDAYVNPQTPTKEITQQPVTYDPSNPTTPVASGDALLDTYYGLPTNTPAATEPIGALPSTPVVDEGYDPLPNFISPNPIITPATGTEGGLDFGPGGAGLNAPSGGFTPDPTIFPSSVPDSSYNPATIDQQINDALVSQDRLVLVPVQNSNGSVDYVYMDQDTGDVASNPDQVVTDPYFTTNPSTGDLGGNAGSSSGGGGGGGGGLPRVTAAPAASAPYSFPVVGGLPTDPNTAMNNMNKTIGSTDTSGSDPSRRAYLSPIVLSTQGGVKGQPTYAQLIPQLASVLSQRGYAGGGQVDLDNHFADILAQRGYPVEMVPGPEDRMYRRHMKRGFAVNGPGTGQSDDIPTMLADGEYVIDADTVAQLGDGSSKAGAQVLDRFREEIRKHKRSAPVDKIPPKAKSPLEYMKAAQKGKKNG